MSFINGYRERWGVEPICAALQVAPSTYYAAASRQPSARQLSDARLSTEIARVHRHNFSVYGIEKVWRQLNREGHTIGRDRVARLMNDLDLSGVVRGKKKRTTVPAEVSPRPADLVERNFTAEAPNRLWWRISRTSAPGLALCTSRSSLMCSAGSSLAGASRIHCTLSWRSMRSRWPSGAGSVTISPA